MTIVASMLASPPLFLIFLWGFLKAAWSGFSPRPLQLISSLRTRPCARLVCLKTRFRKRERGEGWLHLIILKTNMAIILQRLSGDGKVLRRIKVERPCDESVGNQKKSRANMRFKNQSGMD